MEGTSRVALFDLIVERGGLPESQAAQYFDAIVRLTEGALRRDPRYRLMTDHLLITRKGKIELQPPGVKRAPIDRHAPLSPKNQRRHDEPASCNQLEPASCTPADLGEAIADCTKAVRSFESNGESSAAMWALGIVLFSLLAGYPPFAATSSKCRFVLTFFLPDAHHRASIGRRASSRVKFLSSVPTTSSRGKASDRENVPTSYPHLVTCAFLSCAGSSPRTPPRTSCASPTFSPSPRSTCFAAFSPLLPPRGSHGKSWRIWSKSGSANPPAMRPTPPPVPPLMTTRLPLDPREEPREET